jgi:hypothetical protein
MPGCQHLDGKELFHILMSTTLALNFDTQLGEVYQESEY